MTLLRLVFVVVRWLFWHERALAVLMPQAVELDVVVVEACRRQLAPNLLARKIGALRD